MVDSIIWNLYSQLGYFTGEFQASQQIVVVVFDAMD